MTRVTRSSGAGDNQDPTLPESMEKVCATPVYLISGKGPTFTSFETTVHIPAQVKNTQFEVNGITLTSTKEGPGTVQFRDLAGLNRQFSQYVHYVRDVAGTFVPLSELLEGYELRQCQLQPNRGLFVGKDPTGEDSWLPFVIQGSACRIDYEALENPSQPPHYSLELTQGWKREVEQCLSSPPKGGIAAAETSEAGESI